jgi:glycosyltransferase involved in cell wall biosynthesis
MNLWFDVTDLNDWGLGHLTGIQRTSVSVLSELMATRRDIQLFAYDSSRKMLRKTNIHSLAPIVRDGVISAKGSCEEWGGDHPGDLAMAPRRRFSTKAREAIIRGGRYLNLNSRRQLKEWLGDEVTDALRNFIKSGRALCRAILKNTSGRESREGSSATVGEISGLGEISGPILFNRGDVCISLSATWGMPYYGEVIAANTRASGAKCINLIYDLIPALFPEWMPPGHSDVFALWAQKQMANADLILTISNFQKEEISRYMEAENLEPHPIEVIRLGDNPNFMTGVTTTDSLPFPRYIPEQKFVIVVSTLDARKNHSLLYQVWRRLAEELGPGCPQLILIGALHWHTANLLYQIRNDRLVNRLIVHLHDVSDEELAWYYQHCEFTVYPSVYEGWGLPISESLSLGKYCIAGNKTSLPEAGGDLVDYFDPLDLIGCHKLVYRAVIDPAYVRQCEQRIEASYIPHTWSMTAAHISEIVDRIGGSDRREAVR